jgi:3-oxoacyl-ACP reductase-like protein
MSREGIRLIEPELFEGYNPERKQFIQQIVIERELGPVDCSKEEAEQYLLEHGGLFTTHTLWNFVLIVYGISFLRR